MNTNEVEGESGQEIWCPECEIDNNLGGIQVCYVNEDDNNYCHNCEKHHLQLKLHPLGEFGGWHPKEEM